VTILFKFLQPSVPFGVVLACGARHGRRQGTA
jgi:hypothetical protein